MTAQRLSPVKPDWNAMMDNLRRKGTPSRVFYFEHGIADNVKQALCPIAGIDASISRKEDSFRRDMEIHRFLGHELFRVFPDGARVAIPSNEGWVDESRWPIGSWEDFEKFPWQRPEDADCSVLDWLDKSISDDQRAFHVLDVFESAKSLLGFEGMCMILCDDPALVEAVFSKVGEFCMAVAKTVCDHTSYGALYVADDLGYKTSLLMSPDDIRRLVLPWHKRLSEMVHSRKKLFFLHSCGQMYSLMDEFIDDIGIDAKHSFEDVVMPVAEVKRKYGSRVALLGGMDVDLLARADEAAIRQKAREILASCVPGGGYFFGSGNWVTEYIPVQSYLAMLDVARNFKP